MSTQTWSELVHHHIWQLARLKVPDSKISSRPLPGCETAMQAAVNILDELGFNLSKARAQNRTKPYVYVLIGWQARGPHDPDASISKVISFRHKNVWKCAGLHDVSDFDRQLEARGWVYEEESNIYKESGPVVLARSKGWIPETSSMNYFKLAIYTRDQYH